MRDRGRHRRTRGDIGRLLLPVRRRRRARAEPVLAAHQTGRNSGVVHSGLYYKPGSLKARLCAEGRPRSKRFAAERGIRHERCGKIVVAVEGRELERLAELERRGNGERPRRSSARPGGPRAPRAARRRDPGTLGSRDGDHRFPGRGRGPRRRDRAARGAVWLGRRVTGIERRNGGFRLRTPGGDVSARRLINCAGSTAIGWRGWPDSIRACASCPSAASTGSSRRKREGLVRNLIYHRARPRFSPFLGVHFNAAWIRGGVEAGPNAVLALSRGGYGRLSFSHETRSRRGPGRLLAPGAARHWRSGSPSARRSVQPPSLSRTISRASCPRSVRRI